MWMRRAPGDEQLAGTHLSSGIILLPGTKLEVLYERETGSEKQIYAFHMKLCLKLFE